MKKRTAVILSALLLVALATSSVALAKRPAPKFIPNYNATFTGSISNDVDGGQGVKYRGERITSNVQVNDYYLDFTEAGFPEYEGVNFNVKHFGYLAIFKTSRDTVDLYYTFAFHDANGYMGYQLRGSGLSFTENKKAGTFIIIKADESIPFTIYALRGFNDEPPAAEKNNLIFTISGEKL